MIRPDQTSTSPVLCDDVSTTLFINLWLKEELQSASEIPEVQMSVHFNFITLFSLNTFQWRRDDILLFLKLQHFDFLQYSFSSGAQIRVVMKTMKTMKKRSCERSLLCFLYV